MGYFARFILAILLCLPTFASASDDCYRELLVVDQTVEWNFTQEQRLDVALPTWNRRYGFMPTEAAAHFTLSHDKIDVLFDYNSKKMSLPYNFYRLDITVGENDDLFHRSLDFSEGCQQMPIGIYPSRHIKLFPIEVARPVHGNPRGTEKVRVRIWGSIR